MATKKKAAPQRAYSIQDLINEGIAYTPESTEPTAAAEPDKRTWGAVAKDVGVSALKGAIAVPEAAVGMADLLSGGRAGKVLEDVGFRPGEAKAILDEQYSDKQKQAFQSVSQAEGFTGKMGAALANPSVIGHTLVESAPLMGMGGVIGRGVMAAAPRVSGVIAGAIGEGAVGAGSSAEAIRQASQDGTLTGKQAALAGASGALTGAFTLLGGKVAQKLGIADVDTMLVGAATNPGLRKGVVRSALEGAVAEGVLEELPQSVQEQVLQNAALGKPLDEGVDQAAVMGLLSGMAMGGGANAVSSFAKPPAKEAADTIRNTEKLPESGALTKALNAGVEAKAQAVEAGAPVDGQIAPNPAPDPVDDPVRDQILALPDGARQDALRAYAVVNRTDVAKGVQQYNRKLLDRLLTETAPPPVLGESLTGTDMGTMLGGGGMAGNTDPLMGALGMGREAQANSITNVANVAERRPPMPASDAARMLDEARNQGVELAVAEHPAGGFVLVPPNWVTPDMAAQGAARLNETIARMQQADAAPVERAQRTSTKPVDLSLPTDPVQNYMDTLRTVNTPAAQAFVRDFDAGRITPADVQQRMAAEKGKTPDQRIAQAAAEAPSQTDAVADRLARAAAQGAAVPAPTDILNPVGLPFKTRMAADRAAKQTPGAVVPVDGGFVVRPQEPVNVQDVPQAPEVPQAAPAVSQPAQAPQAVGAQPAGPAAGVPAEGTGAVEAAGLTENKVGRKDSAQIAQPESVVGDTSPPWASMTPDQRRRTRLEQEIATGMTNNGGVMAKLRPSAIEKRKQELAAMPPKEAAGAAPSSGVIPAVPAAPAPTIVEVQDNYGRTHRVRQSDLYSNADRIPTVRKNGEVVAGEEIPRSIVKDAPSVAAPAQETIHNGTRIYPTKVKVGDEVKSMWAVESPDNQRRRAAGERAIGGDSLHDTLEQAQAAAEREAKRDAAQQAAKAEQDAADKERLDAEEARKAANRPKTLMEHRKDAVLSKQVLDSETGNVMTRREWVENKVADGLKTSITQEDKIKPMSRRQIFRADNLQQAEHDRKVKEAGKKDVYWLGDFEVTKIEYDYAQELKAQRAAAPIKTRAIEVAKREYEKEKNRNLKELRATESAYDILLEDTAEKIDAMAARANGESIADIKKRGEEFGSKTGGSFSLEDYTVALFKKESNAKAALKLLDGVYAEAEQIAADIAKAPTEPTPTDPIAQSVQAIADAVKGLQTALAPKVEGKEATRETVTPADDKNIGVNVDGNQLYERKDGSIYQMQDGKPRFGGFLEPVSASKEAVAPADTAQAATENVANDSAGQDEKAIRYELPPEKYAQQQGDESWMAAQSPSFKPTARQQLLMDAVAKALDDGAFYNSDVDEHVAKTLGVTLEQRARNSRGVEGGDFGYDVYNATRAVQAQRSNAKSREFAKALNLKPGDVLGTLVFNDGKVTTGVKVNGLNDSGLVVTVTGKRGAATLNGEVGIDRLAAAMDSAKERGKRKDGYAEFVAGRGAVQPSLPAPATHADPGQAPEVATPAVVAQSVQKAARNEDTKPSEMRKWLVGKIDEAIAVAPEAAVDFLSFDVPGDGTFKVQNSQARLQEFRKKVMASPGFKDGGQKQNTKPPEQVDSAINGSGSTVEALRNFLADGDVQGAIEFAKLKGVEFTPVPPQMKMSADGKGKVKHMPASVKSSVPSVAEGLTQVEAEQINQYLTAERQVAEAVAQPITRADVTAAQQQAAAIITERIDAMSAQEVQKVAARFLPTMGVNVPAGKARIKTAMTDPKVNPMAAADEFGATLPAEVKRALQADVEGRIADAGQDDGVNPRVPRENRAPASLQDGITQAQANAARFEIGKSLTKEQRKQVLDSLVDVYKSKGAEREFKGQDGNGNDRYGYAHSPDLFEKSDITGAMVRYYVTLPDGRIAHPTELFPDVSASDIERMALEQEANSKSEKAFENAIKPFYQDFDSANLMTIAGQVVISKGDRFAIIPNRIGAVNQARQQGWELAKPAPADVRRALQADMEGAVADGFVEQGAAGPASKTPTIDRHNATMAAVREGKATAEQFRASFEQVVDGKAAIVAELDTMTKVQLLREGGPFVQMRYANEKKADVVDAVYREMVGEYALGESVTYGMGRDSYQNAVRKLVEATDADKLAQYVKDRQDEIAEAQARGKARAATLENPKTRDDFRNLLDAHMRTGKTRKESFLMLTPDQRIQYDTLEAESTREARETRKRAQKSEVRAAGQTTAGEIVATKHTRDGYDLFVVKLADRLSKEDYSTVLASAKKLGGWYSAFRGNGAIPGFQFKGKANAEAFLALAGGDTAAAQEQVAQRRDAFEDDRSQTAVERLRAMADKLEEGAAEVEGQQRKTNTERRARFASAALQAAAADKAKAQTMRNIAQAIEDGKSKFLDAIRTKSQVDMLTSIVDTAKGAELRAKYPSYADQEKRKGEPPTAETADFADFPSYGAFRSDLATLGRQMLEVDGTKKLGQRLMSVADDVTDAYLEFAKANFRDVSQFGRGDALADFASKDEAERAIKRSGLTGKAIVLPIKRGQNRVILSPSEAIGRGLWQGDGDKRITLTAEFGAELVEAIGRRGNKQNQLSVPWQFQNAYDRRKALSRIGIETPSEFRAALREFVALQETAVADKVRDMELSMVGRKADGLDFFPTPAEVADQMVEAADIQPDMAVLEPSAGMGHLADRIREAGAEPDVIEIASDRRALLEEKGYTTQDVDDFLDLKPREFFTFGDTFRAPDGAEGIMRGANGNRVRLVNAAGDAVGAGYYDRTDLTGVAHNGTASGYDRIIMNPPFSNRRDAEHVRHAYSLLKPGGRIVAIMGEGVFFGNDKKAQEFREWLESVGGTSEKLPDGSFLDPSLPVTTGANARMVVIDKADSVAMFSRAPAAFSFAGQQAVTADQHALTTAQQRLEVGEDAETVRQETGWFQGNDGKWRFEISDAGAQLAQQVYFAERGKWYPSRFLEDARDHGSDTGGTGTLGDVLEHPALFAAYPALRDMPVTAKIRKDQESGAFDGRFITATAENEGRLLSVLLHEIQHGIQNIEGFATGGTPKNMAGILDKKSLEEMARVDDLLTAEFDALKSKWSGVSAEEMPANVIERATALRREINAIRNTGHRQISNPFARPTYTDAELHDGYRRLAGEVEARNTQARQGMTDAQRRATPPNQTADVADADVIVVFNGKEMANAPMPANAAPDAATTAQPLRTPAATIRAAITKAYGKLLGQLESKGLVTLTQTEDEAIEAAAQARAAKTGQSVEQARSTLRASVKNSVADQTQTENFQRWFKDSKVVDADGKPLVVYHGTKRQITQFDGNKKTEKDSGWYGRGIYMTADPNTASAYSGYDDFTKKSDSDGSHVMPLYASIQNPYIWPANRKVATTTEEAAAIREEVVANGHDGIFVPNDYAEDAYAKHYEVIAFRPEQIKSATGNSGAFDPTNPDIRRSADGSIQGFFDPQTGQSFLIADNLTAEAAPGVLMHEVGIHMAADGSMKALFNRAAMMLKLQRGNPFMKAVQDRMDAAGETSGEEAAAYIAEAYENDRANAPASVQRWLADLLAAVKAWMFKKGIMGADRLTVADIAAVARANARSMARDGWATGGQGFGTAFSRAPAGDQTQTEAFKRWFAGSRVVDADGKPLRVYHGTAADIDAFDLAKSGSLTRARSADGAFWFSDSPELAGDYASLSKKKLGKNGARNVMPVFLKMENPKIVDMAGKSYHELAVDFGAMVQTARKGVRSGTDWVVPPHDGMILRNFSDTPSGRRLVATHYVAFHPEQIKSATGNNGNFDPADPDIRFSRTPGNAQTMTDEQARQNGFTLKAYRGISKSNPFNDSGATWLTTSREVAEAYAEEVMGYDDPGVLEVMVKPDGLPRHDASRLTDEQREAFGADEFGNPQALGIYDRSDDHPLGGSRGNVTVIHAPREAVVVLGSNAPAGDFDPTNPDIRFSRTTAQSIASSMGDTLKSITVANVKKRAGFKLTDYLGLGLQALGRRQIVDVYGDLVPLAEYNRLVQQMEADKNEGGAEADQLVTRWAKLHDESKLADLMHDATLAQIDPDKPFADGDDKGKFLMLERKFKLLSDEAKAVYRDTRDAYKAHHAKVRSAIKERIERSEIKGERKAALLKQMDDEFFAAVKGVYFPLARFGQYAVTVKGADGKVESVSRAETKAEAEALRSNLLAAFPRDKGFTVGRVMLSKDFIADRDAVGRGFMTELYQVLDKQDMDAAQRAELEDTLGQLYLSSLPDLSWAKHGIHRKGTPGFSQDARRAYAQNMFHGSRYLAKLRYSDLMQDELTAMQRHVDDWREVEDFDQNSAQRVVDEMNKRHESLMNPKSNPLSTALTSLGFVFHLGLSPASAMVNLSQTALVAYPIMGAKWGFGKASAALLKASAEAAKGKNDITASLNADERAAYDEAVRAGTIDVTMAHDLAGIAQGEDAGVMWKIRPVMRLASSMFHHAERFNRQVTFVAAYRLAREAGADHHAAFEQATKATYDGHFDYGAANRPRFMQGNVAKVLLLFKQYGQNMVYTLARNAQQSIKGESPEVRAQARKALGGLLAMHAAAAGVLGLPMVTTLLAAASMIGGDDDEPWDAKVALQNMLADTFGQKPAEVLAHGLSRLTPWDISGRVGFDRLIFPDVQEGLEGQRLWESAATQALGPVGGIFGGALKGLDLMSDGHYQLGLEAMLPAVLRQGVKSIRYGMDGAHDKSGVSIKDEVSTPAVVGQLLGFSPSEVRLAQEGKSAVMAHDRALSERRQSLLTKAASATMDKDTEARAEAMKEIERFNQKNPTRRITPLNVLQSVRNRNRRIDQAEGGIYLPKNRRDAMDAGRFAVSE